MLYGVSTPSRYSSTVPYRKPATAKLGTVASCQLNGVAEPFFTA